MYQVNTYSDIPSAPFLWKGELTKAELIGSGHQATITDTLSFLGVGTKVTGQMEMKVLPGKREWKINCDPKLL